MAFARGSQMRGFGGYAGTSGIKRGPIDVVWVRKEHNKFLTANERMIASTLEDVGDLAVRHARATNAVRVRSGRVMRGWQRTHAGKTGSGYVVSFHSSVKHAFFHEHGTGLWGPSRDYIRPRKARFLRWVDPDTGQVRFARKVRGVKPKFIAKRSWFQAGVFEGKPLFERSLGRLSSRF